MKKLALVALLAATTSVPALAGDFYVAGAIGKSHVNINKNDLDNALTSAGVTALSSSADKADTAYKILLGYQFNRNFAVEGGYVDFGKANYSANFAGGNAHADMKAAGVNFAALGILPLSEGFSLFGKLGIIDAKVEVNVSANGPGGSASGSASATKWKPTWGGGAIYSFNKQVDFRAEFERFHKLGAANSTGEGNVNLLSAGVVFKF